MSSRDAALRSTSTVNIASGGLLALNRDDNRTYLSTGETFRRRQLLQAMAASSLLLIGGAIFTLWSPWALFISAFGAAGLLQLPRMIRTQNLLAIISSEDRLQPLQASAGPPVPVSQITGIRGVHEIQGWDPRSVFYAVLADGSESEVLLFRGTDDALAIEACRLMGMALDRPAEFTNQYGEHTVCWEAARGPA